jgi:molecular chaperone HscB
MLHPEPLPCWSCEAERPAAAPFCPACGKVQPEVPADHFAVLGMPRTLDLEAAALEEAWRERCRPLHPDRFARAAPRERRLALERATRLNDAYRTLRHPRRRAEYLLRLLGRDPLAAGAEGPAADFLEEQLLLRERLERAQRAGEGEAVEALAALARERLAAADRAVTRLAPRGADLDGAAQADLGRLLVEARFHEALLWDALGGER